MKTLLASMVIAVSLIPIVAAVAVAGEVDHVTKSFPATKLVRLECTMGSCVIKVGSPDSVRVSLDYEFDGRGYYEPEMEFDGDELFLSEEVGGQPCDVSAVWSLTIPERTEVRFKSASGDLDVTGMTSRLDADIASGDVTLKSCEGPANVKTASGDIEIVGFSGELYALTASGSVELRDSRGELELRIASGNISAIRVDGLIDVSVASGDVRADALSGEIKLVTASGDLRATDIKVNEVSSFSSASGDAIVTLAASPTSDISVSSASGDAVLRYNGNHVQGHVEFTALADDGDISSPFKFDTEREFRRHRQDYVRKAFTLGAGPEIKISSGTGEAVLEK